MADTQFLQAIYGGMSHVGWLHGTDTSCPRRAQIFRGKRLAQADPFETAGSSPAESSARY